jgi:hypothetical protein
LSLSCSYGGFIQARQQPYDGYFENVMPCPLRAGERHEYGLRVSIPAGHAGSQHASAEPQSQNIHIDYMGAPGVRVA